MSKGEHEFDRAEARSNSGKVRLLRGMHAEQAVDERPGSDRGR